MSFLTPSDFTGIFKIAQGFSDEGAKLQEYIDYYEQYYLVKLLGADLYTEFLAGYPGDPVYEKLYDPFIMDATDGRPYVSEGVEVMLKCFIYSHYRKQDLGTPTTAGQLKLTPEGGTHAADEWADYFHTYNRGVKTAKTLRQWIIENREDYPAYKGVKLLTTWLV